MQRGSRSIYQSLFKDENEQLSTITVPERKGRSEVLMAKQTELLICRYYFYIKIQRKQYLDTLALLEDEIFFSQRTITNKISENASLLRELNNTKPDIKWFRNKYPFMMW